MKNPLVFVSGALLGATLAFVPSVGAETPAPTAALTPPVAEPALDATYNPTTGFADLVDSVSGAVVAIEVEGEERAPEVPEFFKDFFDEDLFEPRVQRGQGSGFIVSEDGLVLTNHHVISSASSITVKFSDGREVEAELLGSDASIDVALLQLPKTEKWSFVQMGNDEDARVGDWVLAIGNPLGLGHTVTAGIISGKGRSVTGDTVYENYLQTDAAINPGNSGGPLFTQNGDVIGINTAIIAGANTVGFAVPINMVKAVIDDLQTNGRVARGFIGISTQPVTPELAAAMSLPSTDGVLVAKVHEGTPAEKAGLKDGDVIVRVGELDVAEPIALIKEVSSHAPGEEVKFTFLRNGKTKTVNATLTERPDTVSATDKPEPTEPQGTDEPEVYATLDELGVELDALPKRMMQELGITGVIVQSISRGSPAAGHLMAGDLVLKVNDHEVSSAAEVDAILKRSGKSAYFLILRGDAQRFEFVPLEE